MFPGDWDTAQSFLLRRSGRHLGPNTVGAAVSDKIASGVPAAHFQDLAGVDKGNRHMAIWGLVVRKVVLDKGVVQQVVHVKIRVAGQGVIFGQIDVAGQPAQMDVDQPQTLQLDSDGMGADISAGNDGQVGLVL